MKSKDEFKTKEQYVKYLRIYFAGLAMQGIIANAPNGHLSNSKQGIELVLQWTDELLKQLDHEGE
jgi:uncharacterized protein YegJ (DUF2314 family)